MASLNAQRNLNSSQSALATALTRLSSGLRINSAKDDAAGLAISDRFTTQIRGLNQAVRNANDGISLSQTGEGALAEVSNNLQRIRELAVQAANATNSDSDRAALDLEVQQRLAEVDRIASQTNFNGRKILDGSFGNASFQVGADAGQTIVLNLEGSTRVADIGTVASATSSALGTDLVEGHIDVTPANLDFAEAGSVASPGNISLTATSLNFSVPVGPVDGTTSPFPFVGAYDFGIAGSAPAGSTVTSPLVEANLNWTVSGADAHFTVGDGTNNYVIALDGNDYTAATGVGHAQLATDINAALPANATLSATYDAVGDTIIFTSNVTGAAAPQVSIIASGVDATNAGFVAGAGEAPGTDAIANTNGTLTLNTATLGDVHLTLDAAVTDSAELVAELNDAISFAGQAANLIAELDIYGDVIIRNTSVAPTEAITISNVDIDSAAVGFVNSTGVTGSGITPDNSATMTFDGQPVTLDSTYLSYQDLANNIVGQLAVPGDYTSTVNELTGEITISRTSSGISSTAIDISGAAGVDVDLKLGLTAGALAGTDGADAVERTNATFYVDGIEVNLTELFTDPDGAGPLSGYDALASAISGQLADYTAAYDAATGLLTISKDGSTDAVSITGADTNATAAGFGFATGIAGSAKGEVAFVGDFFITVAGNDHNFGNQTYASSAALVETINRELSGISADVVDGNLRLMSTSDITVTGAAATAIGLDGDYTADNGDLSNVTVLNVAAANDAIVRIDSALTGVSNLRSTFGAIQNRFESTISNLTATGENLTASRSRIMDADFAMETAALTRAQILQQAGTAMLAQANQIPQNVLSLLG
jgi:flagellin